MLKVNNRSTRTRYEICSKSRQEERPRSVALIVNFKTCFTSCSIVLIVDFEHVIPGGIVKIFFKPCSDKRQNGFKLFKTKTK